MFMHTIKMFAWLLPHSSVKLRLLRLLGFRIDPSAIVGANIVWRCPDVTVKAGAVLRGGNVFFGLRRLDLHRDCSVGHWNWVSAATGFNDDRPFGCLSLGRGSAITSRHYIDVTGGVEVGVMTTIAGHRSTMLTHGIDVATALQVAKPVTIGSYSLISSNTKIVPGAIVSDYCLVAMGSVLTARETSPYSMWGGNPARKIKDLPVDGEYWSRTTPPVGISFDQRAFGGD